MTTEPATLNAVTDSVHYSHSSRPLSRYRQLWRGVPRELGFLTSALPIVVVAFAVLTSLLWAGIATLIIYVGFFLVVAALHSARAFGTLELARLRWARHGDIEQPQWATKSSKAGFIRRVFGPLAAGRYWLYLLHGYVVNFIIGIVTWTITIAWLGVALGGVTYWFWSRFIPRSDDDLVMSHTILRFVVPGFDPRFDGFAGDSVLYFIVGVICLVTLPFVTHKLTGLHAVIARGMLGAWRSDALAREVADLEESRQSAVVAEDRSLRRLERDLHDGPQQRLLRLQLDLASAQRAVDNDPGSAQRLLGEARDQAGATLEELRALARGFAPPLLQDRGLVAALEALAARSTVPATFTNTVPHDVTVAPHIERAVYFVAAELIANAAKHSGASQLAVSIALDDSAGRDSAVLTVTDNGAGGARVVAGHGLEGLRERLHGLGGDLSLSSPSSGPTIAVARVPDAALAVE